MKEGWKMVKLGEVCEVIAGQSPDSKYYNKTGVGIPFYQGKKEFTDKYIGAPTTWTTMETKIAEENDILMSVRAPVGDVNFAIERICIGRGLAAIRPSKMFNKDYLYYYLVCEKVNIKGKEGAVFPSINRNEIRAIEIPLPPLEEQHRIVGILDAAFAKIDALKANAEANLTNAKALFQQVLAQELQPKEGWVEKKLTDISENLDYKRVPITKNVRKSGKFPYYGASGIVDYVNDYLYDEDLLLISEDGANLLARTTPIAFSVSGKIWVNNHAHVLRFNNLTLKKFVEYFIAGFNITPYVTGMAQPKLNQKALEKIIISFPTDIEEQHRIVSTLDTLSEKCRRLEQVTQQTIRECDALKQSILRQAFSGVL